jgi:hypothetical protein
VNGIILKPRRFLITNPSTLGFVKPLFIHHDPTQIAPIPVDLCSKMPQIVIEGRYIDKKRLMEVLTKAFGGEYSVRVRERARTCDPAGLLITSKNTLTMPKLQLNYWILTIPRDLTEVSHPDICIILECFRLISSRTKCTLAISIKAVVELGSDSAGLCGECRLLEPRGRIRETIMERARI